MSHYGPNFRKAVAAHPDEYGNPSAEKINQTIPNMSNAFRLLTFNHDGRAIRATCKDLGIKPTRSAIIDFLKGDSKISSVKESTFSGNNIAGSHAPVTGENIRKIQQMSTDKLESLLDKLENSVTDARSAKIFNAIEDELYERNQNSKDSWNDY